MNTNPDEAKLALWLDDELVGDEFATFERWAASQPGQVAARDEIRQWRATMAGAIPASEEPPYPDFFNSKVLQSIREQSPKSPPTARKAFWWKSMLVPAAACAGMVLTFWVGTKVQGPGEINVVGAPKAIPVEPVVYTPESGVKAEWFASTKASATVIVLNGVAAIPDSTEFSATVDVPMDREIDFTAEADTQPTTFEVGP